MKPISFESSNYFHDWVSTEIHIGKDFEISFHVIDQNDLQHSSTLYFQDVAELEFTYWTFDQETRQLVKHLERNDTQLMKLASIDRWFQNAENDNGNAEIELIGGNDFSDSFVVLFHFKYNKLTIKVNDKEFTDNETLAQYINELKIL